MSNNDTNGEFHHDYEPRKQSAIADVTFTTIANHEARRDRPSSSRGESFRSEKDKWSARGERFKDKLLTPPRSLSSRKSEEIQRINDGRSSIAQQRTSGARGAILEYSTSRSSKSEGKRRMENAIDFGRASRASEQPSSRNSSLQSDEPYHPSWRAPNQRLSKMPSMDPAQLVQMALNLSESRKRHASNPAAPPASNAAVALRASSAGAGTIPSTNATKDFVREQIGSRASGQSIQLPLDDDAHRDMNAEQYYFSPATLARAEKARKYFELAEKHRRLLLQLPALPTSHKTRPRTSSHLLTSQKQSGRAYNPLQALRNRRVRERQKDSAVCSPEQFMDLDKVEQWLTEVETARSDTEHPFQLPVFQPGSQQVSGSTIGHRHNKTADTVITKPEHDWYISPAELLADTYWTEQRQSTTDAQGDRRRQNSVTHERRSSVITPGHLPPALQTANITPEKVRHTHHLIPLSAANRLRQHRFARKHRSDSMSSTSSAEGLKRLPNDVNVGPLQRHMDEMIRKDAQDELSLPPKESPDHWDLTHTSGRNADRPKDHKKSHHQSSNGHAREPMSKPNGSADFMHHIVSSPESSQPTSPTTDRFSALIGVPNRKKSTDVSQHKTRLPLFHTRSKDAIDPEAIHRGELVKAVDDGMDPSRLSADAVRPSTFRRHKTADSVSSSLRELVHVRSKTTDSDMTTKDQSSTVTRFLRGSRLGEMVRTESSKFGSKLRVRERPGEETISDVSAINSEASDAEGPATSPKKGLTSAEVSDASPRASLDKNERRPRYYLPSFISPQMRGQSGLLSIRTNDSTDHITRQQADLRKRNRSPRFERLAPPRIALPAGDHDPQRLTVPTDRSSALDERRRSYGFLNPALRKRSRSHSHSRPLFGRGRTSGPLTSSALSTVSTHSAEDSRQWSISNQRPPGIFTDKSRDITSRDVGRVRALLLASGIKAREISRRLEVPSAVLPSYLRESARLCELQESALQQRPRKQEYTYAVELLSSFLDEALGSLSKEIKTFQSDDLQDLISRQDQFKARVSEDLTELVHNASDQADAFNIELSMQATLRTKQVDDAVDAVLRLRRRQFRLLRLAAFKMLEWFTLSLLWWVWFVVVCFKTVKRLVLVIYRLLRWLFTF
ncbi:hypothetical protein AMS68_002614 [Peltaster fructicola]|uniref:Uncharacterized protein n=1 Tax=Peltaster fructicola TaxID=286661 RepID=A0A6H0XQR4_9PEZI|nr:hypothetical protein AMS68_002614 [Peltaster fructicola]